MEDVRDAPVRQLITALRSPLPRGFKWNFLTSSTCICGLAKRMGISPISIVDALPPGVIMHPIFNHPFGAIERDGVVPLYSCPARDVTPAMVADALERLLTAGDR